MKPAMYRFKYSNKRAYARIFAGHAALKYRKWLKQIEPEAIVAVPMYKDKKKKRGYNQAQAFAGALSKATGIPCASKLITRYRDTAPMKNVDNSTRKYNLQNAFKIRNNGVKFNKILVVDDIYTSGSTMDGVGQVLKTAGVDKIYCLSVCIGDNTREV
ncbi:MAG: ComF family protein [Pseudobutyrivibrio sp.]|nr:ComF family protein [Pseudobutyrivibrio sp.]